jgi:hypothetical protein
VSQGLEQKAISTMEQDMTNQKNDRNGRRAGWWVSVLVLQSMAFFPAVAAAQSPSEYYTEPQLYGDRPNPNQEYRIPQVIGVSGIMARIDKGVTVTVEETQPNTPAAGKFNKNDIIVGVNGVLLKGKHPWVVLGTALTEAETKDGVLTFDITAGKTGIAGRTRWLVQTRV